MTPMELFRHVLAEIGDVSATELSDYIEKKHGVRIEPLYVPLFKATVQDLDRISRTRQEAKALRPEQPATAT
jgi:hypothetical protein